MSLRGQAGFFIAIAAAFCALVIQFVTGGGRIVDSEDALRNSAFFGSLLLALISGFLAGWMLGPIFGQKGFGGWLLGLIGALLVTALTGLIAGGLYGAFQSFLRPDFDPVVLLGEGLANGLLISFVVTRYLFGSLPFFGAWLMLFILLQILMIRSRQEIAEARRHDR